MEYYFIYESREPSVIGHYPQTKPSEDKRGHFDGYDSKVRMYADKFPDFEPKYGIDIHPKAFDTDLIDRASLSFGFVVSERLKSLLKEFELPSHRFYPIDVFGTNKVYYWFHYITNIWKYIDFESTEIEVVHKFKFNLEQTKKFNSFEEVMNFKKSLPRKNILRFGSIKLKDSFPNYDVFEITGPQYFTLISEKLKRKLIEENITGINLKECDKISLGSSLI